MAKTIIAPSILSANFANMGADVERITKDGADFIHVDVMDGHFVQNITFGPKMVSDIRPHTNIPLDVHLMISDPKKYANKFIEAGADYLTFHIEALKDAKPLLEEIKSKGVHPGIVISPDTEVDEIFEVLPYCDMVLVMSVYPGFGGQKLIARTLDKVKLLKKIKEEKGYNYLVEIDGGVCKDTIKDVLDAGAEVVVAGSAVFGAKDWKEAMDALRKA